jgi:hypothetical protein
LATLQVAIANAVKQWPLVTMQVSAIKVTVQLLLVATQDNAAKAFHIIAPAVAVPLR